MPVRDGDQAVDRHEAACPPALPQPASVVPDQRRSARRLTVVVAGLVCLAVLGFAQLGTARDQTSRAQPSVAVGGRYAGAASCLGCHPEVGKAQRADWHNKLLTRRPHFRNCEECHGGSAPHAASPDRMRTATNVTRVPAERSSAACLRCHEGSHGSKDWKFSRHCRVNVACWHCHSQGGSPHSRTLRSPGHEVCFSCHHEQQASFAKPSHHPVREGRLTCSDCHEVHQRPPTAAETTRACASCHKAQRGPHAFAHGSLSAPRSEGCQDCHRPHGSPHGRLLKTAGRGLCLQCHVDQNLHFAGRTCWTSGCHAQIHGSNTSRLLLGR